MTNVRYMRGLRESVASVRFGCSALVVAPIAWCVL
jgi:hypothetical protein